MGLMKIVVDFIPQEKQRIEGQVGDYFIDDNVLFFKITEFSNPAYSYAILLHELHEKFRNDQLGIKDMDVDQFDIDHPELDDPGLSLSAPYHKTHMESDAIERLFIILTGNDWINYSHAVDSLFEGEK
jgi:thiol-disulfide isomerase/thioredoxin